MHGGPWRVGGIGTAAQEVFKGFKLANEGFGRTLEFYATPVKEGPLWESPAGVDDGSQVILIIDVG